MDDFKNEIWKYLRMIYKRRYLFISILISISTLIIIGTYLLPEKYRATSTIFIERNVIEKLVKGIAITPSMESRIKVLRDTMLSRSLILKVLEKLDLDAQAKNDIELEKMIMRFQEKTELKVKRGNSLINISFTDKDPVLARDFVNTLVTTYVEQNIFAKREEAYSATEFLKRQVEYFKKKLEEGEKAIMEFRKREGIFIAMDEKSIVKDIQEYNSQIEKANLRIMELTAIKKSLEDRLKKEDPYTITIFSKESTKERIKALERKLNELLVRYTENYPEVIKIKAELEGLKAIEKDLDQEEVAQTGEINTINPLYQELKQKIMDTEAEISALKAKINQLKRMINKKRQELKQIPESRKKLADLIRERDSFKDVYEQLLVRLGQSEVSKQMEIEDKAATFRIIEPAILPKIPVSPNRPLLIIIAMIVGFLGAFGVVYFLDYIDHSIKSIEELKSLGIPVFAVIPEMKTDKELKKIRIKNTFMYGFTGLYITGVTALVIIEKIGIKNIEEIINKILQGAGI